MYLNYPVFAIKPKGSMIYVFFKEKDLRATNTILLSNNVFADVTLIDSSGSVYKIKKAYKVKNIGLFGLSLLKKGKQILVDFEFENEKSSFRLFDFKQYIIMKIEENDSFWKTVWDIEELKGKIMNCTSFDAIANLLK